MLASGCTHKIPLTQSPCSPRAEWSLVCWHVHDVIKYVGMQIHALANETVELLHRKPAWCLLLPEGLVGSPQPQHAEYLAPGVCCLVLVRANMMRHVFIGCVVCGVQPNQYAMSSDRPVVRPTPLTGSRGVSISWVQDVPRINAVPKPPCLPGCWRWGVPLRRACRPWQPMFTAWCCIWQLLALHFWFSLGSASTNEERDSLPQ